MDNNGRRQDAANTPEHLIPFPGGQWAVWKCVGLRGAGFPVTGALRLGVPDLASKAEQLIDAGPEVQRAGDLFIQGVNGALDEMKRSGEWADQERVAALLKARSAAKANKLPKEVEGPGFDLPALRARLMAARDHAKELQQQFPQHYWEAVRRVSEIIREVAATERFREAVIWQNRKSMRGGLDAVLRMPAGSTARRSDQLQRERLVTSYLQRYCVKNDTIGFFGPVGWAEFVREGPALTVRPGENLVQARKTYFEVWGIEALAKQVAGTSAAKPWLRPIRLPFVRVDGTTLHHPYFGVIKIPAVQAAVLTACTGERTAREIARLAMRWPSGGLKSEPEVYALLEEMANKGLIFYGFNIPLNPFPERVLRQSFEQLGDDQLRREALAALDELEAARAAVESSAGDAEQLYARLEQLEETFNRLTGAPVVRSHGKMYAARTLVYEDCRRDIEVEIGPDVLKELAGPLSLLLTSARWLTHRFAEAYRERFKKIYDELVSESNSKTVDPVKFWLQVLPLVFGGTSEIKDAALAEFRSRWDSILSVDLSRRRVCLTSEELRPKVEAGFFARRPGWKGARYHSPDIMIAAPDAEAVNRSDYQLVMGEFHVAVNTLAGSLFFHQHPDPESLIRATWADMRGRRVLPVTPKEYAGMTARTSYALVHPDDIQLEFSRDSVALSRSGALPIASLVVEEEGGELIARTRDNSLRFNVVEFVGNCLNLLIVDSFRVFTNRPHTPRISIDRLVVSRETWRFAASELTFAFEKNEADRFAAARRWARAYQFPRFLFVKAPVEPKPFFLDLDSPSYIDILAKLVRATVETGQGELTVTVSEMLPGPEQTWLVDAEGQQYTSEFRMVIVDLAE